MHKYYSEDIYEGILHPEYFIKGVSEMYVKGAHVKLRTDDSWDNLFGIVDEIHGDTIAVFCTLKPMFRYYVSVFDADNILEIV